MPLYCRPDHKFIPSLSYEKVIRILYYNISFQDICTFSSDFVPTRCWPTVSMKTLPWDCEGRACEGCDCGGRARGVRNEFKAVIDSPRVLCFTICLQACSGELEMSVPALAMVICKEGKQAATRATPSSIVGQNRAILSKPWNELVNYLESLLSRCWNEGVIPLESSIITPQTWESRTGAMKVSQGLS